jgi:hypothetical protein
MDPGGKYADGDRRAAGCFSLYDWLRPESAAASRAGLVADGAVGIVNGVIGSATGLAGIAPVVWCRLRSWAPYIILES